MRGKASISRSQPYGWVIDKTGKIRLIRVGSGEANAKEIQEMIEKLIEE